MLTAYVSLATILVIILITIGIADGEFASTPKWVIVDLILMLSMGIIILPAIMFIAWNIKNILLEEKYRRKQ